MRELIYPLLLAALSANASKPDKFQVVVHTSDRVVVNYICTGATNEAGLTNVVQSVVQSQGGYTWHVVGGQAPYTVVDFNMVANSGGCITVQDANGLTSTGCGTIGVHTETAQIDCTPEVMPDTTVYRPAPTSSVSFNYPVATKQPLGPERKPVGTGAAGNDPVDPPTPGPIDDYRPPVKSPSPDGPKPPVGPVAPVKDPVYDPRPGDNPAPPPTPRPHPVHDLAPVHNPGRVNPPVRSSAPVPAPRPSVPIVPQTSPSVKPNR